MKKLAIIGASGHGKVVADIAEKNGYKDIVFLDDFATNECAGYPIVGTSQSIKNLPSFEFIIAIGDNKIRERLQSSLPSNKLATLIHPTAVVSRRVNIEEGTVVMAGAIINSDVKIGKGVIINTATSVDHDCKIEDFVHLSPGCHVAGNVTIGRNSWLGIGATVVNNIKIETSVIIGAGSTVINNLSSNNTYIGTPAKELRKL